MKTARHAICSILALAGMTLPLHAGPLEPPAGPVNSTMKTLAEIEPRLIIGGAFTPGDTDSLFKITSHGSYYLNASLTVFSGREFLEITASNVVVDLGGFRVNGAAGSLSGIRIAPGVTNVTIRNGTITGFDQSGIVSDIGAALVLENLVVTDVGADGVLAGAGSRLRNITVIDAGADGIQTYGGSIVRDCVVVSAGAAGFFAAGPTSFEGCSARESASSGFAVTGGSSVRGSFATGNNNYAISAIFGAQSVTVESNTVSVPNLPNAAGIYLWGGSTARNNTVRSEMPSASCIFLADDGNRVEGNTTSGGARSVGTTGDRNLVVQNFHTGATAAGGAFPLGATNMTGPVVTTPGTLSNTNAFANFHMP